MSTPAWRRCSDTPNFIPSARLACIACGCGDARPQRGRAELGIEEGCAFEAERYERHGVVVKIRAIEG
jgi:hypothetical protein